MFNASTTPQKEMRRDRLSDSVGRDLHRFTRLRFCAMGRVPCWRRPSRRKSLTSGGDMPFPRSRRATSAWCVTGICLNAKS